AAPGELDLQSDHVEVELGARQHGIAEHAAQVIAFDIELAARVQHADLDDPPCLGVGGGGETGDDADGEALVPEPLFEHHEPHVRPPLVPGRVQVERAFDSLEVGQVHSPNVPGVFRQPGRGGGEGGDNRLVAIGQHLI